MAKRYIESKEADKCELLTLKLLESQTGQSGEAAVEACERNVGRTPAPSEVIVREYEVGQEQAEVELLADGQEGVVRLRNEGGKWKITGFAE